MIRNLWKTVLLLTVLILLLAMAGPAVADGPLRVATFRVDVTPPKGHMIHWHKPLETVETPLLAKGIVLDDGVDRCIVCALDWCLMSSSGYRSFRKNLAAAAGTAPSKVAVQCVHQHTAPRVEPDVQRILNGGGYCVSLLRPGMVQRDQREDGRRGEGRT